MAHNLYLFYGGEDFLIDAQIKSLKSANLDYKELDASQVEVADLCLSLQTVSIWGGGQLAVIKNFEKLDDSILSVLENLAADTIVIFCKYGSVDKRTRLYKFLNSKGEVAEFKPLAEWEHDQLADFVRQKLKVENKKIGAPALTLLIELSGTSLRVLDSELDKLITYTVERDEILAADVLALAGGAQANAFTLLNSLRRRDAQAALSAFEKLIQDKAPLIPLLQLLVTQFRMLFLMKSLKTAGLNFNALVKRLKLNPYFARKSFENLNNFKLAELREALEKLHALDLELKTTTQSPRVLFELLISDLTLIREKI